MGLSANDTRVLLEKLEDLEAHLQGAILNPGPEEDYRAAAARLIGQVVRLIRDPRTVATLKLVAVEMDTMLTCPPLLEVQDRKTEIRCPPLQPGPDHCRGDARTA